MQGATSENTSVFTKFIAIVCAVVLTLSLMPLTGYAADKTDQQVTNEWLANATKVVKGAYEPGTYTVDANFYVDKSNNPAGLPVTAFMTNPNNPFGTPMETENMLPSTVVPSTKIPNNVVLKNATLVVGEDDSLTLTVPILNSVFTLHNVSGAVATSGTATITNFDEREGSYPQENPLSVKRIQSLTFDLGPSATTTSGWNGYTFAPCTIQAAPAGVMDPVKADKPMELSVNFANVPAKKTVTTDPVVAEGLVYTSTEQTGVTFDEATIAVVSGDYKATNAGEYSVTLQPKDGNKWSDGTTEERVFTWSIAKADLVKKYQVVLDWTDGNLKFAAMGAKMPSAETVNAGFVYEGFVGTDNETNVEGLQTRTFVSWNKGMLSNGFVDWMYKTGIGLSSLAPLDYTANYSGEDVDTLNYHVTTSAICSVAMHPNQEPVVKDVVYNGKKQVGLQHRDGTELTVVANALHTPWADIRPEGFVFNNDYVNVGEYTSVVVPTMKIVEKSGYWSDGTDTPREFTWNITPATLTAQPKDNYIYEGETPDLTQVEVTGFVEGENAHNVAGYVAPKAQLPEGVTVADLKGGKTYELTAVGGEADNYTFEYTPGILTVLEQGTAGVPMLIDSEYTYDGKTHRHVLDGPGYTLVNAEAKDAGTYVTTAVLNDDCTKWSDGSTDREKTFEWTINKAQLTAVFPTQDFNIKDFQDGTATPNITSIVTGFVNGEHPALNNVKGYKAPQIIVNGYDGSSIPATGAEIGNLASDIDWKTLKKRVFLIPANGEADNYEFTYKDGIVFPVRDEYGYDNQYATGFPYIESQLIYTGQEQVGVHVRPGSTATSSVTGLNAGTYETNVSLDPERNRWAEDTQDWFGENKKPDYEARDIVCQWSIAQAPLSAKATDITIAAGETPEFSVEYAGFLGSDNETNADGFEAPVVSLPEGVTVSDLKPGKTYELTVSGGKSTNYYMNEYTNGTLTVLPEEIADFEFEPLTYNGKDQAILEETDVYEVSGEVSAKVPGEYEVTVTLKDGYVWADGTEEAAKTFPWTIQKATLTASYAGETIVVGEKPELKVEISGFVEGENADNAAEFVAPILKNENTEVGEYALLPEGGEAAYYNFVYAPGVLKIVKEEPVPPVDPEGGDNEGTNPDKPSKPEVDDETTAPEADKPATPEADKMPQTNDMAKTFGAGAAVVAAIAGGVAIFARRRMMD